MKLKQVLAAIMAAAMVVTSAPVTGLSAMTVFAEDQAAAEMTEVTRAEIAGAVTDCNSAPGQDPENALTDEGTKWHSAWSGDGQPIKTDASRFTAHNHIFLDMNEAVTVDRLEYTVNGVGANGSIQKVNVYVATEADADKETWEKAVSEYTCPAATAETLTTSIPFDKAHSNVKKVIVEVLNTYGNPANTYISGKKLQLFNEGVLVQVDTVSADMDSHKKEAGGVADAPIENIIKDDDSSFHSPWAGEAGVTPVYTTDISLTGLNNYYITLTEAKKLGKLVYISAQENGSILSAKIYVSNAELQDEQTVKDIADEDWTMVYDGTTPENTWAMHNKSGTDSDNTKEAVFTKTPEAKYVRIEAIHTYGDANRLDQFISARLFKLYEIDEVKAAQNELKAAITAAMDTAAGSESAYTTDTWSAFKTAYDAAKDLADKTDLTDVTKDALTTAKTNLETTFAALAPATPVEEKTEEEVLRNEIAGAVSDCDVESGSPAENALVEDGKWHSAYNSGQVVPTRVSETRMTENNKITMTLNEGQTVDSILYTVDKAVETNGQTNGNILKANVYVATAADATENDWIQVVKEQDCTYTEENKTFKIAFDKAYEDVKKVIVEVLNTGGSPANTYISGMRMKLCNVDAEVTIDGITCDAQAHAGNEVDKLLTDDGKFHTLYAAESGIKPITETTSELTGNNNFYITLTDTKKLNKLTYVSAQKNGTIKNAKVYVSNATLADGQTVQDIADWQEVYNGSTDWPAYADGGENSTDVTFGAVDAKYVRIEAIHTYGDTVDKFISAKQFKLYAVKAEDTEETKKAAQAELIAAITADMEAAAEAATDYSKSTWDAYKAAYDAAKELADAADLSDTSSDAIKQAQKNLEDTYAALVKAEDLNKAQAELKTAMSGEVKTAADTNNVQDGDPVYTDKSWTAFKEAYDAATALAEKTSWDTETVADITAAKEALTAAYAGLRLYGAAQEIDITPDVTLEAPKAGEALGQAVLTSMSLSTNAATLELADDAEIAEDGAIKGRITDANPTDPNSIFNVTGTTKLLFRMKIKGEKPTDDTKQSLMGKMNDQYGVQMVKEGETARVYFYAHLTGGWAEVSYTMPDDYDWNAWHDLVAYFDGNALHMYVDGNKPSSDRGIKGELQEDTNSVFTLGYNYAPKVNNQTLDSGWDYKGWMKDIDLYIGDHVPTFEIADDMDAATVTNTLKDALENATSDFVLSGSATDQSSYMEVESTTWSPEAEAADPYTGYKATVVLKAKDEYTFKEGATGTIRTSASNVLDGVETVVSPEKTTMTLTYTFKGQEHPRTTLDNYVKEQEKAVGTENKTDSGDRKYTKDSWTAYEAAKTAAEAAISDTSKTPEECTTALNDLKAAVDGLKLASENCECTLGDITGFEGKTLDLIGETELTETLTAGTFESTNDCMKHKGAEPAVKYELMGSPAGATLTENVLKVTQPGNVQVRMTVTLGDQTKSATATYTVVKTATAEEKQELNKVVEEAEAAYPEADAAKYTPESMKALQDAIASAKALGENASAAEVAAAKEAINAAVAGLKEATPEEPGKEEDKDKEDQAVKAAKEAVDNAVKAADAIMAAGQKNYTDDSWKAFSDAYKAAKEAPATADAATLKKLADTLTNAQKALAEKQTTTPTDDTKVAKTKVKKATKKGKKLTVTFKKISGVKGYQVSVAKAKKFTKKNTLKTVKAKKTSVTIKKLKNVKSYYVRVRGYKVVNGKTVYGKWSVAKKAKVK